MERPNGLNVLRRAKETNNGIEKNIILTIVLVLFFITIVLAVRPREVKLDGPDFNDSSYGDFTILSERSGIRGNKIIELADNEENTYTLLTDKDYNPISISKNSD
jgi:hypothetical protein